MKFHFLYTLMLVASANLLFAEGRIESLPSLGVIELAARLEHVQGVEVAGTRVWVSSVDRNARKGHLRLFDLSSRKLVREVEVQEADRFHPGGIALDGRSIWVPVAEYKANSSAVIQKRHRETLALEASFEVKDHVGCLAVLKGALVGGNWDSRILYRWALNGQELGRVENRTGVAFQDLKTYRGGLLIGGGVVQKRDGAVAVFDPLTGEASQRWTAGKTDRGVLLTQEGLAFRRGRLYLLPEDGASRLFIYRWRKTR